MEEIPVNDVGFMKETFSISITSKFVYLGVQKLALSLRYRLGLRHFVETGTFMGGTSRWAAQYFDTATSIEINPTFHNSAASETPANVRFLLGDSRDILPIVVAGLDAPALFYLDAHNQDGLFGNGQDDCPALSELQATISLRDSAILVDDASSFSSGRYKSFPSLEQILELANRYNRAFAVAYNMIAIVPRQTQDLLDEWVAGQTPPSPEASTEDNVSDKPNEQPAPAPVGGFVSLNIDDTKIEVIRHPDNAHLDRPTEQPEPPAAA